MMELFEPRLNIEDVPMDRGQLAAAMNEADVFVPTVTDRIDADLIKGAGDQLKLIASFGTGATISTSTPPRRAALAVTTHPRRLTEDTADMTWR